jgi:hypothetical protein
LSGPWEKYAQPAETGPWAKYGQPAPAAPQREMGSILPMSWDKGTEANVSLDWNAGLPGVVRRAFTAPGDVMSGKLDPMSPEGQERAREMVGFINPATASFGKRLVPGMKAFKKQEIEAPTAEALKEAAEKGYQSVRGMGVDYSSQAAKSLSEGIQRNLEADGVLAELSPKTFTILRKLQEPPDGSVASLDGLIAARRALQNAAGDFTNKTEQMAATKAIKELDRFIEAASPEAVVAGDAAAASKLLAEARGNTAAAKRSERITDMEDAAQLRAEASNSGNNVANTVRQRIVSMVSKPKETRGYSPEEIDMMRQIARGTPLSNFTRNWGNRLGGGGGLGGTVTGGIGAAVGAALGGAAGPLGSGIGAAAGAVIPPAVGFGLKKASTALTQRQINALDDAIRQRSPLYRQMERNAPMVSVPPVLEEALIRSLFMTRPREQQ